MDPSGNPGVPAQWTHEAAREGTVPLCEDAKWKPAHTQESPHSGLMKQPTREGSVSRILAVQGHPSTASVSTFCNLQLPATCQPVVRAGLNVPSHQGSMSLHTKGLPKNKEVFH